MSRAGREGGAKAPSAQFPQETAQLVSYLVLIAIAVALFLVAGNLPSSRWEPLGAGTFPQIVMGVLGALAAIAAVTSAARLSRGASRENGSGLKHWLRRHSLVIKLFAVFFVYLALIEPLGFSFSTLLYLLVAQLMLAPPTWQSWIVVGVLAVTFSFGLNWLFAEVFNVFLPRAQLG